MYTVILENQACIETCYEHLDLNKQNMNLWN